MYRTGNVTLRCLGLDVQIATQSYGHMYKHSAHTIFILISY